VLRHIAHTAEVHSRCAIRITDLLWRWAPSEHTSAGLCSHVDQICIECARVLREATAINLPLVSGLNHGTVSKHEEAGGVKSGRASTPDSSYGLNAPPRMMGRGGKKTSNKRLAPSCGVLGTVV
jgi:hypothetical protein